MLLPSDFRNGTRTKRRGAAAALVLITVAGLFAVSSGCGGGSGKSTSSASAAGRSASLTLSLTWPDPASLLKTPTTGRAFPVAANSLVIHVTDSTGFSDTQILVRPPAGSANTTVSANFFALSPGQATITAAAFASQDGTGPVLSQTGSTVSLQIGQQSGTTLNFISPIVSVAVAPVTKSVLRFSSVQLFANATDDRGNVFPATGTFATSDPAVATVDASGNVTGVSVGTAVITFTGATGLTGHTTVSVLTITQIGLTPFNAQIVPGATLALSAVGKDANGAIQQFNPTGTWASANPVIATVDGAGNVTGVSAGTTTISFTDTVFGITGTTPVSVRGGDAQVTIQ